MVLTPRVFLRRRHAEAGWPVLVHQSMGRTGLNSGCFFSTGVDAGDLCAWSNHILRVDPRQLVLPCFSATNNRLAVSRFVSPCTTNWTIGCAWGVNCTAVCSGPET